MPVFKFSTGCCFKMHINNDWGFPSDSVVKNLPANAGDKGLIPDLRIFHVPWSNKPPVPQLRSPCSRAQEPQLLSPHAAATEAQVP